MLEQEAKLVAPAGFRLPQLGGPDDGFLAEPQPARRYTTTYWDTPDLRLARWGASLRYRDDEGWTVKLPAEAEEAAGVLVRDEHTLDGKAGKVDGKAGKVPEEATALLRIYVRSAPLQPVVWLRTVRQPVELRNAAGERLAELVDDQVQVVEGRRVVDRFRELEVELGDGAQPDTLDKVLARLQEAGATRRSSSSASTGARSATARSGRPSCRSATSTTTPRWSSCCAMTWPPPPCGCSVTSLACGWVRIPRPSTRRVWASAGCAPRCGPSSRCWTRNGWGGCVTS
jgi:inorganic triphosphatase YgiF